MQPDRVQLYYRLSIRSGSTPGLHTSQTGVKKTVFFPKAPVFFTQLPAFVFQALKPLLKSAATRAFLLEHFSVLNERNSTLRQGGMRGDPQNFWQGQRAASRYLSRRNSLFFRNSGRSCTQKKPLDRNSGLLTNF